jgi:hypothetical protein
MSRDGSGSGPEIIDLDSRPIAAAPVDRVRPSGGVHGTGGLSGSGGSGGSGGSDGDTRRVVEALITDSAAFEEPRPAGRISCEGLVKI